MKKMILIAMLMCAAVSGLFAQNNIDFSNTENPVNEKYDFDFSYLDTKLLFSVTNIFSRFEYQNKVGDFFTNKQVKNMVLGIPENEKLIKQYNGFMAATYTLLGIFVASCVVDVVYTENKNLPNRGTVLMWDQFSILMSYCGIVLTGNAARVRMHRAVDNYNYSLLTN